MRRRIPAHAAGRMQVRDATIAQVDQVFLARDQRSWHNLLRDIRLQCRLLRKFPAEPGTEEHCLNVVRRLEEFEFDLRRRVERVISKGLPKNGVTLIFSRSSMQCSCT